MILINSAEFDYAQIDLSKDMFFAGDNGTGKTSSIIALFYLFSGDNNSYKLGISADKKSFKEYYFPDERNSFIIYVFENFFIFMYKQNGEVFKRFSKKVFKIKEIVKETQGEQRLESFKNIQDYLKNAPLTYLAKSSEYRAIIYGQNPQYLDFKITSIKNYAVFIELFQQTFNVDKSIVDANSIKRAIQKSLNVEEKNIEFNYEKYMNEIKKFQESYLFFRKFEKESDKVLQSFNVQEELLSVEKKMENLHANMLYRKEVEVVLLEEKQNRLLRLKKLDSKLILQKGQKQKSLNRVRERFAKEIATLEKEISDIEKLKVKFEPKIHQIQQSLFAQLHFLEKEQEQKQQQLTLLESNILDALKSVDQEIRDLSFKQDNDLQQQKRVKLEQIKIQFSENLAQEKERLKGEIEHTEHRLESQTSNLKVQIEEQELILELEKSKANELHAHYREKLNLFRELQFKEKKSYQEQIEKEEDQERSSKKELKILNENRETLKRNKKQKQKLLAQNLWEERQYFNHIIKEKKNILFTVEGSFKAFLQQSGISWEKELYPFMDSALLSISTDVLSPKILNAEMPLGIELDMSKLKQIPTREESEESIRQAKVKKQHHFLFYKEEKNKIENQYNKNLRELERNAKELDINLKEIAQSIETYKQKITKISSIIIPQYEAKIKVEKEKELQVITQKIEALLGQIKSHKIQVSKLNQELKIFIKAQQTTLKIYQKNLNETEKKEEVKIETWLQNEREKINKEINNKKKNRETLSKSALTKELKETLLQLKEQIQKSYDAGYYLKEYADKKEFMDSLSRKKSRLIMSQQNRNNLENKLLQKQDAIIKSSNINQEALLTINKEITNIEESLGKIKTFNFDNIEAKESSLYLSALIEQNRDNNIKKKELRVNLKELLSRINSLKNNPFLDISFKLENFSFFNKLSEDFETLEKLSELKDFKEKKFEILKETSNEKYFNFIKSEIPSKLGSLSHSEDKFQEQVKKINKNLSTIDFSIVKNIKINPEIGNKRSVMALLNEMNGFVQNLTMTDTPESLFFDRPKTNQDLQKIATLLSEIKDTLKGGAITLLDTIDLSLEFVENGTKKANVTQIKNESSTGGTILLKMALAVSILGLYTQEKESTFFLILDEVSRLHSHNQDLLRSFANSRGFRIVFVTPEPVYAKPDEIKYYKFMRREDNRFEIIGLNI
ncbi:MAG: Chromosome partition protein smc [uncultured Sulfurovum sp.]|uniref:Chromosome partition protein smc n=1 Tax=uncultured Sulfurovum sp. TaxID=269237 RepID=A0A6S6SXN5_9BACT|nr:MAG: Chromosome partition protein smc [uncultured Sulfurovum sp.]